MAPGAFYELFRPGLFLQEALDRLKKLYEITIRTQVQNIGVEALRQAYLPEQAKN